MPMKKSIVADVLTQKLKDTDRLRPEQQVLVKGVLETVVRELGIEDMVERRMQRGKPQTPFRKKDSL